MGKDADLVLWTDNPLSIYATVSKTFVDGKLLFDAKEQIAKDEKIKAEKNRIVQKMLFSEDTKKGNTQPLKKEEPKQYHCDTLEESENHTH